MNSVTLPPDLERFAEEALASGRYRDVAAFVEAAIGLLHRVEADRTALITSLERAQAEGERDGFSTTEAVEQEVDAIITAAERQRDGCWRRPSSRPQT